ncbi:hypothetical protein HI914_04254 [Erysiphe necator]|nr:hypothetical protein HI914_04254 [Erysiphe necator]
MQTLTSNPKTYDSSCSNFGVDLVIRYNITDPDKNHIEIQFARLIEALQTVGLTTEVRYGSSTYILIFVKDSLIDFIVTPALLSLRSSIQEGPITRAERLRLVYTLITSPISEGGVGVTPNSNEWKYVDDIFPLHDNTHNKQWIKKISSRYILDAENLAEIRDQFGEKTAFYFAFVQSYFLFLILPASFGFCAWLFLGPYSPIYAIFNGLWCIIFVENWKKKQKQLKIQWGMKDNHELEYQTRLLQGEITSHNSISGLNLKTILFLKQLLKQFLQIPYAVAAIITLGGLITICFGIEVFISEIYNGPFKKILVFLPTIILTVLLPAISAFLTKLASELTDFEDDKSRNSHETSMIRKIFVLNFIISYFPIFLTAFVYVPFGQMIFPYLNNFHQIIKTRSTLDHQIVPLKMIEFKVNKDRLISQVIYFTVTAQISNFGLEIIVPFVKRKVLSKIKEFQKRNARPDNRNLTINDHKSESKFLIQVRNEAEMKKYDVTSDFREMIIQFGYLSLFSVVWPLTAVSFLFNNWIEIRGDAIKMVTEYQRSIPWRADSIGPWLDALDFLAWLGSITSTAFVYLFSANGPDSSETYMNIKGLLVAIIIYEHLFLAIRLVVRKLLDNLDSSERQFEKVEWLKIREGHLKKGFKTEVFHKLSQQNDIKINISDCPLEDDSINNKSAFEGPVNHQFWKDNGTLAETVLNGKIFISRANFSDMKKQQ